MQERRKKGSRETEETFEFVLNACREEGSNAVTCVAEGIDSVWDMDVNPPLTTSLRNAWIIEHRDNLCDYDYVWIL